MEVGSKNMISVIMLTYNRENMVGRAIESILQQTFTDFEFIIVDNGSNDESGKIAEQYAQKDSRIRVIHKERGSIGYGRNVGLDAAGGDYIVFIDDDDWVEADFLDFLYSLIHDADADISICGSSAKQSDEKITMTAKEAIIELMWRRRYNTGFPTKMFKRELFQQMRFSETEKADDIGLIYRLIAKAEKVAYHGLPKYNVCRHSGNNSAWTTDHRLLTKEILNEYLRNYRVRTEWLSEKFPDMADLFQYFEWSFMISMIEKICRLEIQGCDELLRNMKEELWEHRQKFLNMPELMDFEREWLNEYVVKGAMK